MRISVLTLQMAKCNLPSRAVLQPDVHFLSCSFSPFASPPLALISPSPCSQSRCPSLLGPSLCSRVTACDYFPKGGKHNPGVQVCVLELFCKKSHGVFVFKGVNHVLVILFPFNLTTQNIYFSHTALTTF